MTSSADEWWAAVSAPYERPLQPVTSVDDFPSAWRLWLQGFARAWIGAAAARRLGNTELAWRHLRAVATTDEVGTDQFVPWLSECLALAEVGTAAGQDFVALADRLIAAGRVPALFAPALGDALRRHCNSP